MKKKLALDLHGVVNTYPAFFAAISNSLLRDGWEIHLLTGSHLKDNKIEDELKGYGFEYSHIFSIADFHRENVTPGMWYDEKGDPWVSDEDWDKTKADYCKKHEIDFCIDDTARYANYFETPFGYMSIQMSQEKPNKYLNLIISMFEARSRKKLKDKVEFWINKKIGWFFSPKWKSGKINQNSKYN